MVHPEDQEKMVFTMPWGTFMYAKMPFRFVNPRATFQRSMDITFVEEKDKILVIYLNDITMFFKSDEEHVAHLLRVFKNAENSAYPSIPRSLILP